MAKPDYATIEELASVAIKINQRIDALFTRLKAVERHVSNPAAHGAAHVELKELLAANNVTLPARDDVYGQMDEKDLADFYTTIRSQPGAQDRKGICHAHERTCERFGSLFRYFGWAA